MTSNDSLAFITLHADRPMRYKLYANGFTRYSATVNGLKAAMEDIRRANGYSMAGLVAVMTDTVTGQRVTRTLDH